MFEDSSRLPGSKSVELAVEDRNRVKVVLVATGFNHWRPQDGPGGTDVLRALVRVAAASTESTGAAATRSNVSFGFSNTVALKMNSSSRNARLQCNRAGSHPNPPYPCPDEQELFRVLKAAARSLEHHRLGIRRRELVGHIPLTALRVTAGGATIQQTSSHGGVFSTNLNTCPFTEGKHQRKLDPQNSQQGHDDGSSFGLSRNSPQGFLLLALVLQSSHLSSFLFLALAS